MAKAKTLFMETTEVPVLKTAGEITECLVENGASHIVTEYSENGDGQVLGLAFSIRIKGYPVPFNYRLPVRIEPVFNVINGRRVYAWDRVESAAKDRAQAERVAWRQLLRWVQAQMALIQTGMSSADEVFLPYLQDRSGRSMYQLFQESAAKMIEAPTRGSE